MNRIETAFNLVLVALCLIIALSCAGCNTSARTEFIDADGTSFKAIAKAGLFGKLDTTNQHLLYNWSANEGKIGVGNEAQGLDNTGQIAAITATGDAVGKAAGQVIAPLINGGVLGPHAPGAGGASNTPILDKFNSLCDLICRIGIAPPEAKNICGCDE